MNAQRILEECRENTVRLVRFLYCDNGGLIRGKAAALPGLEARFTDGIGLTVAMMAFNACDQLQPIEGMSAVGEIRLVPDLSTFALLPYSPRCAALCCDMLKLDGTAWEACPRGFLNRMRQRALDRGMQLRASFEAEFALARPMPEGGYAPLDEFGCFTTTAMQPAAPFVDELVESLEAMGLTVAQYNPEAAHGQQEVSILHSEALRAADNQVLLRDAIRGVAGRHGLVASLAPKPWPEDVGNGAHIHFSLWNAEGRNLFFDPGAADHLSECGRRFMAGVLAHLPALVTLTCPSVNSYRRLQPKWWSSAYVVYGHDNREAAVRIASPFRSDAAGSVNLELKAADATCNPYIALGGLLAAGLDGIERSLDPGPAVDFDPATLSEPEREARGIRRLPESLDAALDNLESDPLLLDAMGPLLARSYLKVRRSEADFYRDKDVEAEIRGHFLKY